MHVLCEWLPVEYLLQFHEFLYRESYYVTFVSNDVFFKLYELLLAIRNWPFLSFFLISQTSFLIWVANYFLMLPIVMYRNYQLE